MPQVSVELTDGEQQELLACAEAHGVHLHELVRDRLLGSSDRDWQDETAAIEQLTAILAPRIEEARNGNVATESFESIIAETHTEAGIG